MLRARQQSIGAVTVIGGNGSGDVVSTDAGRWAYQVLLGCAKAASVGRGHEHPHGKKKG